jgi:2-dehydro-3-deoxygluconokinase
MLTVNGDVATYGEPLLRISSGTVAPFARSEALAAAVGGAELNVGVALASLGRPTRVLGAVPDSFLGDMVVRAVAASGASTEYLARVPDSRLGVYFVEKADAPRRHRVVYDRSDSAFTKAEVADAALDGVGLLVVSGITAALGDEPRVRLEELIRRARERGVTVAIDVNHRALLWDAATAARVLRPIVAVADIVICAARDADALFGAGGTSVERAEILHATTAQNAQLVVVTDGERGAAAVSRDETWSVEAMPTRVVDRFGAGDAFVAGLLWGLTGDRSIADSLAAGAALAAMVCTVDGDSATFRASELEAVLADPSGAMLR